ncbi:MAG: heat-inducible transcriptional repressor HrcA [Defluviitaleaceae bacterium]|nr:heat-inducible transcriptional repressor HrcA [Defluviitaleaceae bacterium]
MLNERKIKILEALISEYITFGEPVSSRAIAKRYNMGVSSATIRNEMSDLEELGLIQQTHASSGRVPTDQGYRMHVDRLVLRDLTEEEMAYLKSVILSNVNHMEYLMKETAKAISLITNYTTIVSEIGHNQLKVKHIQLMPMDAVTIVVTVITITKLIKNTVVNTANAPDLETLNHLTITLNRQLKGKTVSQIKEIKIKDKAHKVLLESIITAVIGILTMEEKIEIFASGINNILTYPEFDDLQKAKNIFKTLEEKEILITLLNKDADDNVQVVIGSENALEEMKDCSIIRAAYKHNNNPMGAIGIIGPTRMDYHAVSSVLNSVVKNINATLYALNNDKGSERQNE